MIDLIDVGISGPLPTGLGFFDLLRAAAPGPALRLACRKPFPAGHWRLFHVPQAPRDGTGPLSTPAVRRSRRATLDGPNLTADPVSARALNSLLWLVSFDDACECSLALTLPSDSSAAPGLRLPGWLHYREGFRPWTVVSRPPVQRLLPWNTCRERQG